MIIVDPIKMRVRGSDSSGNSARNRSVGGGWLSSWLIKQGWDVAAARKRAMLVCALCVLAVMFVPAARGNLWLTVALIATAASAHQGWSANLFSVATDCFPRSMVGSIIRSEERRVGNECNSSW